MITQFNLNTYIDLFTGHKDYFGCHQYKETVPGQKEKGSSYLKNEPLTPDQYKNHLLGKYGIGVAPIDSNNNVRFAVIDIDDYHVNIKFYQRIINEYELPFTLFRSKSGGLHIYVFFNEDIKARKVKPLLNNFLYIFNLKSDTEIFPKQTRLLKGAKASWINIPYFKAIDPVQYCYDQNCKKMTFSAAMLYLPKTRLNFEQFKESYNSLPWSDAPICLQAVNIHKQLVHRNIFLFDMATYLKAKFGDYEEEIIKINNDLEDPLTESELQTTVINSQQKKTYSYRCKESPMCDNCNKELCLKREFGHGGDQVSKLSFENLVQVRTNDPYYKWTVNGVVMTFYSESELRDQHKFTDYCMRDLHIVPNMIKRDKWYRILEQAFKDLQIEDIDPEDDISPGALLNSYIEEFLLRRAYAKSKDQVRLNRVWKDIEKQEFIFRKESILNFLFQKNFRYFSITEVQERLRKQGAMTKKFYIGNKVTIRVWTMPFNFVKEQLKTIETQTIDFSHLKEEEEF